MGQWKEQISETFTYSVTYSDFFIFVDDALFLHNHVFVLNYKKVFFL